MFKSKRVSLLTIFALLLPSSAGLATLGVSAASAASSHTALTSLTVDGVAATPGLYNRYEVERTFLKAMKITNIEKVLPDPKGPNAIPPRPDPKVQIEQMKLQGKQMDLEMTTKIATLKLMNEHELNQAKIAKMEAEAIRALEEAGGVAKGHVIAELNAAIALHKAKNDGIMQSIEALMLLTEADKKSEEKE